MPSSINYVCIFASVPIRLWVFITMCGSKQNSFHLVHHPEKSTCLRSAMGPASPWSIYFCPGAQPSIYQCFQNFDLASCCTFKNWRIEFGMGFARTRVCKYFSNNCRRCSKSLWLVFRIFFGGNSGVR